MRVLMSVASWDASLIEAHLKEQQFLVTAASDGTELFECLNLLGRPIVLLETSLPDVDWRDCLRALRRDNRNMSILILNSKKSMVDQNLAFALGADDVIPADIKSAELAARIRAIKLRRSGHFCPTLDMGPLRLRMNTRRAFWGPVRIDLTPTQYTILETVCLAAPYAVSKDVMMAELYGVDEGSDISAIGVYISQLRSRLVAAGAPWDTVETVYARGYCLSKFDGVDTTQSAACDDQSIAA